jgi:hypothetical protein
VDPSDLEVVVAVLGLPGVTFDMIAEIEDGPFVQRLGEHLDADAEIRFLAPDGGEIGLLSGPFQGIEGFVAGWREWLAPWEDFRASNLGIDEGEGERVAALSVCEGRMRGSGTRLEQETALVLTLREGRIRAIDHYLDHAQARRAAGADRVA